MNAAVDIVLCGPEDRARAIEFYARCGYAWGVGREDAVFLATEGGQVVGAARLAPEQGALVLRGMQVAADRRRQGIGTRLLAALDAAIGDRECWCIPYHYLTGFYASIGFAEAAKSGSPAHLTARAAQYRSRGHNVTLMKRPARNP